MDSYAARLASFNVAHQHTKKRSSNARGGKTLEWTHKMPAPPQLARAGFYYQPTSSCPDNTRCYLCQSNLDGWEENDDAVEEHLRLAPNCGWAITVAIEQDIENGSYALENPMSEKALNARRMTFGSKWPHESKRGWVCKTQKMIDAGWHYCPTLESDDFVKCSYCNLSLDGWEPKDNPFNEHQRRSPDCSFFTLCTSVEPKITKSKKSRASKASRLSTQSNATTNSQEVAGPGVDESPDDTILSATDSTMPNKPTKRAKKASRPKRSTVGKGTRKQANSKEEGSKLGSSFIEPEDDDFEVKVLPVATVVSGGRKRKSEDIAQSEDDNVPAETYNDVIPSQLPAKRRRTTRASSVAAQALEMPITTPEEDIDPDAPMSEVEATLPKSAPVPKKKGKPGKKRSSTRKASAASNASKASLRAAVPNDEEINAALEAELDRPLTDDEGDMEALDVEKPKGRRLTRTKPGLSKVTASVAPTRRGTRASSVAVGEDSIVDRQADVPQFTNEEESIPGEELSAVQKPVPAPKASSKTRIAKTKVSREKSPQQHTLEREGDDDHVEEEQGEAQETAPSQVTNQTYSREVSQALSAHKMRSSQSSIADDTGNQEHELEITVPETQNKPEDLGHESDSKARKQKRSRNASKKAPAPAKKGRGRKKAALADSRAKSTEPEPSRNAEKDEKEDGNPQRDSSVVTEPQPKTAEILESEDKVLKEPKASKAKGRSAKVKDSTPTASVISPTQQPNIVEEEKGSYPSPQQQSVQSTPKARLSPQSSDAENHPPSSRPSSQRPPLSAWPPSKPQTIRIPLAATTPTASPSRNNNRLQTSFPWTAVDLEQVFQGTPSADKENILFANNKTSKHEGLTSPEKKLNVEEWIKFNAQRGEEKLRSECERMVGKFEGEGMRALKTLEGIVCSQ